MRFSRVTPIEIRLTHRVLLCCLAGACLTIGVGKREGKYQSIVFRSLAGVRRRLRRLYVPFKRKLQTATNIYVDFGLWIRDGFSDPVFTGVHFNKKIHVDSETRGALRHALAAVNKLISDVRYEFAPKGIPASSQADSRAVRRNASPLVFNCLVAATRR